jgi:hypothetical protein
VLVMIFCTGMPDWTVDVVGESWGRRKRSANSRESSLQLTLFATLLAEMMVLGWTARISTFCGGC